MKKRIISLFLCLFLLPGCFAFAAGSESDPLLSLSYVENKLLPEAGENIKNMVAQAAAEYQARLEASLNAPKGMLVGSLSSGDSISFTSGQTVILVSGRAQVSILGGSVLNTTVGYEASNGRLNATHRYVICENSTARVDILENSIVYYSASAKVQAAVRNPFADVSEKAWYYSDVLSAYGRGLVNGTSATTYEPESNLRVSQAIKLAACMYQLFHEGEVSIEQVSGNGWYVPYVEYCIEKGIIAGEFAEYDTLINRREFIEIFYKALPETEYGAINEIADGAIGDVDMAESWAGMVYAFYRAGILTGYTSNANYNAHDFGPESYISRAEVATIMNRMFDAGARVKFTIG